jgi:spermidine synthase
VSGDPDRLRRASVVLLFFFSGFCNLVYEVVWARMFNLVFGVTVFAVSAVLTSFMLGLAFGGIFFGRLADRTGEPLRLFAWLHGGICLSTAAILLVFPAFGSVYLGVHAVFGSNLPLLRGTVFLLCLLLLVVPTTLMGATFPAAIKALDVRADHLGRDVGSLYAVSTLGSIAGCVATVSVLLELAGMRGTILVAAFADLAIGMAALFAARFLPRGVGSA